MSISLHRNDRELQIMKVGGNKQMKEFFASQSFPSNLSIEQKYTAEATALYRDRIKALADGQQPKPIPKIGYTASAPSSSNTLSTPASSSSASSSSAHRSASSGNLGTSRSSNRAASPLMNYESDDNRGGGGSSGRKQMESLGSSSGSGNYKAANNSKRAGANYTSSNDDWFGEWHPSHATYAHDMTL